MTKDEQIAFVRSLTSGISAEVCRLVEAGLTPEEWDGHELRVLLAERFDAEARMSELRRAPRQRRARAYRNHLLITPGL